VPKPRLACGQRSREIEEREGFAGAPLAGDQTVPDLRDQMLNQPCLEWPRIRTAVGMQPGQIGVELGCLFVQALIIKFIIFVFSVRLGLTIGF
jgi:hypothetical protein